MRITGFEFNDTLGRRPTATINAVVTAIDLDKIGRAYSSGREVIIQESPRFNDKCWDVAFDSLYRLGLKIKRVVFHDSATIVFWMDGTKTVVKTGPDDIYNPEVGLAMCISKKALGDGFHHEFKKWIK